MREYVFAGRSAPQMLGTMRYTVIFLTDRFTEEPPFHGTARLRMRGKTGHATIAGAWQPSRGRWYVMLLQRLLRQAGYRVGDLAMVRLRLESSDVVDVPEPRAEAGSRPGCAARSRTASPRRHGRKRRLNEVLGWIRGEVRSLGTLRR